jgi:hypothetical protein
MRYNRSQASKRVSVTFSNGFLPPPTINRVICSAWSFRPCKTIAVTRLHLPLIHLSSCILARPPISNIFRPVTECYRSTICTSWQCGLWSNVTDRISISGRRSFTNFTETQTGYLQISKLPRVLISNRVAKLGPELYLAFWKIWHEYSSAVGLQ